MTLRSRAKAVARGPDEGDLAESLGRLVVLTTRLTQLLPLQELIPLIGESACRLVGAAGGTVWLAHPGAPVRCGWAAGMPADFIEAMLDGGSVFPPGQLLAAAAGPLRIGRLETEGIAPILYADPGSMPADVRRAALGAGCQALGTWALVHGGRTAGVVSCSFAAPRRWSHAEQEVFHAFCGHAAIALENARLHEDQVLLAMTDSLTGLPNRRALQQELDRELARAARKHEAVSVLLVDVDHFKRVNDTYGHSTGDAALQALAGILHTCCRSMDLATRYGGDEFIVVLPETRKPDAVRAARRIQEQLARLRVRDAPGVRLRISIGVACTTDTGTAEAPLLNAADRALYKVKAAGGDAVGDTPD
ncbi:MAG TPA: sensor domain-containing diguanylate cyclase [bacterium]|nr:sensor domain-containing diguanylate cyclase [bacterium]